jgi:hypothetical protein
MEGRLPGRPEITAWFDGHLARAGTLADLDSMTPENLYRLMAMHLGWYWDREEMGELPHAETGEPSAFTALFEFLQSLIDSRRKLRAGKKGRGA